jgi:hypothetical protein
MNLKNPTRKQRFLVFVAIACGTLAAIATRNIFVRPLANLGDERARKNGYRSANEMRSVNEFLKKCYGKEPLTDADFSFAESSLKEASQNAEAMIIVSFGFLGTVPQRTKAIQVLHHVGITKRSAAIWRVALTRWSYDPLDRVSIANLASDRNPAISEIAEEVKNEQAARNKERLASKNIH